MISNRFPFLSEIDLYRSEQNQPHLHAKSDIAIVSIRGEMAGLYVALCSMLSSPNLRSFGG